MNETGADETLSDSQLIGEGLFEESMSPGSAFAHLYRGEVHRMTRWRERLDRTTNWAVTVMAAILTWAFSDPGNPHFLILMGAVAVGFFLGIEAHRFRGFIVWRTRVRLLQENVWAQGLDPSSEPLHPEWRAELAEDYRHPSLKISYEEALAHRLRRIYLPILSIVLLAWLIRTTALSATTLPSSASIGGLSGRLVVLIVIGFYLLAIVITFRPRTWKGHPELRSEDIGKWREE